MEDKLRTLARMQILDDEIGRCRELQKVLPQQLDSLIRDVEDAQAQVYEVEEQRNNVLKKQNTLELDIKQNQALILKYGNQLAEIKTNKEYKALNSEIANLKAKNSDLESVVLELMEEDTLLKRELHARQEVLNAANQRKDEKEDDLRQQINALEGKIEELRGKRNELAVTLPTSVIKQYANLIKFKNNQAVAYNHNGSCGGCGFVIRPQIRIELDLRRKIITCESCGRILMNPFNDL